MCNDAKNRPDLHAFFERHDLPCSVWTETADVVVFINGSTFFLDVSFVSLVEATYVQRASEDAFAALRSREQHKITKYSEIARGAGGVVVPFVLARSAATVKVHLAS